MLATSVESPEYWAAIVISPPEGATCAARVASIVGVIVKVAVVTPFVVLKLVAVPTRLASGSAGLIGPS